MTGPVDAPERPLGSGLEMYGDRVPDAPVLILGGIGAGRRSWVEWVLKTHAVDDRNVLRLGVKDPVTIEEVRALIGRVRFVSRSRLWVTVGLDGSSDRAQNALLKFLEEVPAWVSVLVWGVRERVLPTIASRCRTVTLRPGDPDAEIARLMEMGLEAEDAVMCQRACPGRIGAAYRLGSFDGARLKVDDLLYAVERADRPGIGYSLAETPYGSRLWMLVWARSVMAGSPMDHKSLARIVWDVLPRVMGLLVDVPSEKAALRAACTVLINARERA